ncbi:MAG: iron ABC transporter permease [Gemmatimonadota bacterium]
MSTASLPVPDGRAGAETPLGLRAPAALVLLGVLCVIAVLGTLSMGTVRVPVADVLSVLFGGEASRASWSQIVLEFRLPRALTSLLGGAALGASGLLMQTIFRNPLAGPWVLGVSDGAVLGVTAYAVGVGLLPGVAGGFVLGGLPFIVAALCGAALILFLIGAISRRVGPVTVLVAGLMIGSIAKGLVSFLYHFLAREEMLIVESWSDGTFAATRMDELTVLGPLLVIGLLMAAAAAKPLNGLLLGEMSAETLGVSAKRTRLHVLTAVMLLAGGLTAFAGPVAFIGVAVPHMARGVLGTADHRVLLPGVILVGGALGVVADLVVHLPWYQTLLHLNAVTALLGAPVVLWAVLSRRQGTPA